MQSSNDLFLSCKESRIEYPRSYYGCFYLGPFNPSESLIVANSVRRILLSQIPGVAVTAVQIEGASHEFSRLPGVVEEVSEIVQNLTALVLKSSNSLKNSVFGYIKVRGPGIVRASDIKFPPSIQCVDPDQYIAKLATDGVLDMKLILNEGKNLQLVSQNTHSNNFEFSLSPNNHVSKAKSSSSEISNSEENLSQTETLTDKKNSTLTTEKISIPIDASFMPVTKANYVIETYGSKKLVQRNEVVILEVWTNGSLHPREALYTALNHLMLLFSQLDKMKVFNSVFNESASELNENYQAVFQKMEYDYFYYNSQKNGTLKNKVKSTISQKIKKNKANKNELRTKY